MIQHLLKAQVIGNQRLLPAVVRAYPDVPTVPIRHPGAPKTWSQSQLWSFQTRPAGKSHTSREPVAVKIPC